MGLFEHNIAILHQAESERAFLEKVVNYALLRKWLVHHVLDTRIPAKRMGQPGFPDLVLVRQGRLVVAELKSEKGRCSKEQNAWLQAFEDVKSIEVYIWRPSDFETIVRLLGE